MSPLKPATAAQLHDLALPARTAAALEPGDPAAQALRHTAEDTASMDLTETAGALMGTGDSELLDAIGVVEGLRDTALGLDRVELGAEDHSRSEVLDGVTRASLGLASMAPGMAGEVMAAVGGAYNIASGAVRHDVPSEVSGLFQLGAATGLLAMMNGVADPAVSAGILVCEAGRLACRIWAREEHEQG